MTSIRVEHLTFAFGDATPILSKVTLHFSPGWTGLVGENGCGKTTLLRLLSGELLPDSGAIRHDPKKAVVILCPQEVEEPNEDIAQFARRDDKEALRSQGHLELTPGDLERWSTLSPGERKRWQVGAALAHAPDVLLLDEPTNHADFRLRSVLLDALTRFRSIGVVVSHDRALLNALCQRTVRLCAGQVNLYPYAYNAAREAWEAELQAAWRDRAAAQEEVRRASRKLTRARRAREAAEHSLSGRRLDPKDHDARSIMSQTTRAWAEDRLGSQVKRLRGAVDRARAAVPDVPAQIELGRSVFVDFVRAPRPTLLSLDAQTVWAGDKPLLRDVHLRLGRDDRIRLEGPNGSGKTTLLTALLDHSTLDENRLFFLPQETLRDQATSLLNDVRRLEREVRGRVLSLVAALGTDPERLLASLSPSPGEIRKLQLALGLGKHVWALVLDEPTNHLDLPTVERLEKALVQYPGAILLVSHDDAFARRCTNNSWRITSHGNIA